MVENNTLTQTNTDCWDQYPDRAMTCQTQAITLYSARGASVVQNNTISGFETGIYADSSVYGSQSAPSLADGLVVQHNQISNVAAGLNFYNANDPDFAPVQNWRSISVNDNDITVRRSLRLQNWPWTGIELAVGAPGYSIRQIHIADNTIRLSGPGDPMVPDPLAANGGIRVSGALEAGAYMVTDIQISGNQVYVDGKDSILNGVRHGYPIVLTCVDGYSWSGNSTFAGAPLDAVVRPCP